MSLWSISRRSQCPPTTLYVMPIVTADCALPFHARSPFRVAVQRVGSIARVPPASTARTENEPLLTDV